MVLETDNIVETSTKIALGEEETTTTEVVGIIDPIIGITVDPEIKTITEMVTGTIIDQIIEGKTATKGMVIETRTMADARDRDRDRRNRSSSRESSQSRSSSRSQNRHENRRQSRDDTRNRYRSESRSRSSSHISTNRDRSRCYRCNEYDHFARECPNDTAGRNSDDAKGSLLKMIDTDQTYALDYADGEDYDIDLNM